MLACAPSLNVPGMTGFTLSANCVLGLMPEAGIKRLLGERLPDPAQATGIPRAETSYGSGISATISAIITGGTIRSNPRL